MLRLRPVATDLRTLYYALPKVYDLGKMTLDAIRIAPSRVHADLDVWTLLVQ